MTDRLTDGRTRVFAHTKIFGRRGVKSFDRFGCLRRIFGHALTQKPKCAPKKKKNALKKSFER